MRWDKLVAGMLFLACCAGALAQPKPVAVVPAVIGGVQLALPVPARFRTVPPSQPVLARLAESITPPSNRLLAFFVDAADLRAVDAGTARFERYFLVQTARAVEDQVLAPGAFAQLRDLFRNQQAELIRQLEPKTAQFARDVARNLARDLATPVELKVGDLIPLGIYDDTPTYLSFGLLSRVQAQIGTQTRTSDILCVTTIVYARGKAVFLYAYAPFGGPKEVDWAKRASRAWTGSFLKLNPG